MTPGVNEEMGTTDQSTGSLNNRLGAKGQTDYTPGRESYREYPRRSTSRMRGEEQQGGRGSYRTSYGYGIRNRSDFENRGEGRYGTQGQRGTGREEMNDAYSRSRTEPVMQRGAMTSGSRYGQAAQREAGRGGYGRYGGREDYRGEEGRGRYEDYDRYGSGRDSEQYGGRDYDRLGSGRDYDRYSSGRDYDRNSSGMYGGRSYNAGYQDREYNSERFRDYNRDYEGRGYDYDRYSEDEGHRSDRSHWGGGRGYMRCGDIMSKDVTTCSPQTSLREVAEKLDDENVGSLPVLENGKLVGIITDRDIVCRVLANGIDARNATVAEAMSEDLVTVTADDSLYTAIEKMGEHQIRRLPVIDINGRLRGIISMADIALEAEADRELAQALERVSQPTPTRARKV